MKLKVLNDDETIGKEEFARIPFAYRLDSTRGYEFARDRDGVLWVRVNETWMPLAASPDHNERLRPCLGD